MHIDFQGHGTFVGTGGADWQEGRASLVLQHGAGMDRTVWVLLARYAARHGYNVIAADFPAHGASKGEALTSIEAQGQWLLDLIDQLRRSHGLPDGQLILGGHSMGALAVLAAAQAKPSVAESLILFGAAYPMPVGAPLLDASSRNEQAAIDMITFYSHSFSSRLGHNPIAGINVYNTADALLRRAAPGVLHTDLQACNQFLVSDQALKHLGTQLQCSLISGAEDRMTPAKFSSSLAEALGAEVFMLEDCGHMMMGEQPEACLQAMMKALCRRCCAIAGSKLSRELFAPRRRSDDVVRSLPCHRHVVSEVLPFHHRCLPAWEDCE